MAFVICLGVSRSELHGQHIEGGQRSLSPTCPLYRYGRDEAFNSKLNRRHRQSQPIRCAVIPDDKNNDNFENSLLKDAEKFRAKRQRRNDKNQQQQDDGVGDEKGRLQSVIETILVWDFFIICILLGWLAVAVVIHYTSKNDVLLDPWLSIWPNVTQPLLGILMLGTLAQGAYSYFNQK